MTSIHDNRRFVILHGHFYQPPRENPWLGFIERQPSAAPFRHWTERITEECYRANAFSPVLARNGRVADLVNNFEHLSFNIGPTLMEWLEPNAPDVHRRIIAGDRRSAERLDGHGNALAQCYNHAILPLASRADKLTQVRWGLEDFEQRFGRRAAGIWLPETAVDQETVEILIECGVRFTVLAPTQLEASRPLAGNSDWEPVADHVNRVHHRPYRLFGRDRSAGHLDAFFFHPAISREISFEHLLRDGRTFARRLAQAFSQDDPEVQELTVATDGETFGHHEPFANMCLSWIFGQSAEKLHFRLTNFGHYLAHHPPRREARLQPGPDGEGTAWSCAHGVGRWTRDCGCSTGAREGWNQQWRTPLRKALDGLRERADAVVRREGLDPAAANIPRGGTGDRRQDALAELHYFSQLMFTSCGWFFNDIGGLEPVQNLLYARRAAELLENRFGEPVETELQRILARARSNEPNRGHGARIYRREVLPRTLDAASLVAGAALLVANGIEQPLDAHGDHRLETAATERIRRGDLQLEAGWSRLSSRLAPLPRPFLHLVARSESGSCRAWAEETEEPKAESAFRTLLAALARGSVTEILEGYDWRYHREAQMPIAFREMLEGHRQQEEDRRTAEWMIGLHGTGRELYRQAVRDKDDPTCRHPSPAGLALARLFERRVGDALNHGGPGAHRPARGMLRIVRALHIPLDTSAGRHAFECVLMEELDHPELFTTPGPLRRALRLVRLAVAMGLDPAGNRALQIHCWQRLDDLIQSAERPAAAPAGLLKLAELLGFNRRSLALRLRKNRPATPA